MIGSATATQGTNSQNASLQRVSETYDTFLRMLTTQIQNQDPLSPMDTTDFTNQLVAYSQVEQQIQGNQYLEALVQLQANQGFNDPLALLGREVEVVGDTLSFDGAAVEFGYGMPGGAAQAIVEVVDGAGRVVHQEIGRTNAGRHEMTWDGSHVDGGTAADGIYQVRVRATNADGEELAVPTFTRGTVTGVETLNGQATVLIGNVPIALADVLAVRQSADG